MEQDTLFMWSEFADGFAFSMRSESTLEFHLNARMFRLQTRNETRKLHRRCGGNAVRDRAIKEERESINRSVVAYANFNATVNAIAIQCIRRSRSVIGISWPEKLAQHSIHFALNDVTKTAPHFSTLHEYFFARNFFSPAISSRTATAQPFRFLPFSFSRTSHKYFRRSTIGNRVDSEFWTNASQFYDFQTTELRHFPIAKK